MINRGQILTVLLATANIVVVTHTVYLWRDSPWKLPQPLPAPKQQRSVASSAQPKESSLAHAAIATNFIVEKNLFDPERGQGKADAKETEALTQAMEKIRDMVLTGTVILGENRYALLREGTKSSSQSPNPNGRGAASTMRLKVGDTFEGFQVAQIEDRKVSFNKGATNIDLSLDYFRRIDDVPRPTDAPIRLTAPSVRSTSQNLPSGPRRSALPPPPRP